LLLAEPVDQVGNRYTIKVTGGTGQAPAAGVYVAVPLVGVLGGNLTGAPLLLATQLVVVTPPNDSSNVRVALAYVDGNDPTSDKLVGVGIDYSAATPEGYSFEDASLTATANNASIDRSLGGYHLRSQTAAEGVFIGAVSVDAQDSSNQRLAGAESGSVNENISGPGHLALIVHSSGAIALTETIVVEVASISVPFSAYLP